MIPSGTDPMVVWAGICFVLFIFGLIVIFFTRE